MNVVMDAKLGGEGAPDLGAAGEALRELGGPLFGNLTTDQLNALLESAPMTTNTDGDVIIQQGDIGRRFFMVLAGEVDIFKSTGFGGESPSLCWIPKAYESSSRSPLRAILRFCGPNAMGNSCESPRTGPVFRRACFDNRRTSLGIHRGRLGGSALPCIR